MEETHVYTVAPRRPIRGLVKGKIITKPMNLNLTRDEVLFCLKYGPVYRKFYLEESERVTPSNLDRLHRSEHLTEEQYKALCEKSVTEENTEAEDVKEAVVEDKKKPAKKSSKAKVEEAIEDVSEVPDEVAVVQEEEVPEESKKVEEEQSSTGNDTELISSADTDNPVEEAPKKTVPKKKRKKKSSSSNKSSAVDVPENVTEDQQE